MFSLRVRMKDRSHFTETRFKAEVDELRAQVQIAQDEFLGAMLLATRGLRLNENRLS